MSPNAMRIGLIFFLVVALLVPPVRAKEFTSNQYGFQMTIPTGYREQPSLVLNSIVEYIESEVPGGGYPITIDIRHTGPGYNPADKTAVSQLPRQKGWSSSLETRRWKDMELQVIRQEIDVSSIESYVSFMIVFPLKDEGIIVTVQGLKKREKEIAKVFDDTVRQFVNLKPYSKVVASVTLEDEDKSIVHKLLANFLLPVATGALVVFWIAKVRKAKMAAR